MRPDVEQRGRQGRGVQQRRQQAVEHELARQAHLRHAGHERQHRSDDEQGDGRRDAGRRHPADQDDDEDDGDDECGELHWRIVAAQGPSGRDRPSGSARAPVRGPPRARRGEASARRGTPTTCRAKASPAIWAAVSAARSGLVAAEVAGQRAQQPLHEQVPHQVGSRLLGCRGAQQPGHRAARLGGLEHADAERRQAESDALAPGWSRAGHHLLGVERQLDDGDEQVLLAAEVVGDQPGVDAGVPGDAAQRRARVALLAEGPRRGGEDRLARAAARGPLLLRGPPGLLVDDIYSSGEESMPCRRSGEDRLAHDVEADRAEVERAAVELLERNASPSRRATSSRSCCHSRSPTLYLGAWPGPAEVAVELEAQDLLALVGVGGRGRPTPCRSPSRRPRSAAASSRSARRCRARRGPRAALAVEHAEPVGGSSR